MAYHKNNLRDKLIREGIKLFNSVGYKGFSMRKVAINCKISHNAPYRHFKNRDDFLSVILNEAVDEFKNSLIEGIDSGKSPEERVLNLGLAYIDFFIKNPDYMDLFFKSQFKGTLYLSGKEVDSREAYLFQILERVIKDYLKSRDISGSYTPLLGVEIWSYVQGVTTLISSGKVVFEDGYRVYVKEMLLNLISRL